MVSNQEQHLGKYRVLRLLGRGGFADVYLGQHLYLKSYAALKVLRTSIEDEDVNQFMTEAQMLARLVHPHIVRVLDFDVIRAYPYWSWNILLVEHCAFITRVVRACHSKQRSAISNRSHQPSSMRTSTM